MHESYSTPFYIRTIEGETGHVDSLEEALEIFSSDIGYRLTLSVDGITVVIRRASEPKEKNAILGDVYEAEVTIKEDSPLPENVVPFPSRG